MNKFPGRVKKARGLMSVCATHGIVEWVRIYRNQILCCQCDGKLTVNEEELSRRLDAISSMAE